MGGRASRTKGHSFERLCVSLLRPLYPDAKRGLQTQGGTKSCPDVDGTPYYIECKKQRKQPNAVAALRQSAQGSDGRIPVAITAKDRDEPVVTMFLSDWLALVGK